MNELRVKARNWNDWAWILDSGTTMCVTLGDHIILLLLVLT
jgi:hypothetical protein